MQKEQKIIPDASEHQVYNSNINNIIPSNMLESQLNQNMLPEILSDIMQVLNILHPNADYSCKLNILISKISQMIGFKRVNFQEFEYTKPKLINYYAINFMPSGMGKDKISDDLDDYIFGNFRSYFKDKVKAYKEKQKQQIEQEAKDKFPADKQEDKRQAYIRDETEKVRDIVMELSRATPEGLYSDAEAFSQAGFGSIFVKISEFGLLLQNNRAEDLLFLNCLFEAYDGKILSKATKYDRRKENIENMPVSALLHSDPTLFKSDIQKFFDLLLQTGLVRRAIITFQNSHIKTIELNPEKARERQEQCYLRAKEINEKLIRLFINIPDNAVYKLTKEAYDNVFYPYKIQLTELSNKNNENDLINKEITSRELKVLKLSGIYACLNHPKELVINEYDVQQAIDTIEILSKDLKKFIEYKPKVNDGYENLLNFFIDNAGKSFTKTVLVSNYRQFGFKREIFRKDFDEIMIIISEMANEKGYFLKRENINNNSGVEITLIETNLGKPLPEGMKDLNELI